ncbi:hypothetical protein G9A89_007253 [Geosiphon pyriformis]|nr:hypothetical protein G9A89_007253 [Geosiphon pyriformis]
MTLDISNRATFEFDLNNIGVITRLYSPLFATSDRHFWQLEFDKVNPESVGYCGFYLRAITNEEEKKIESTWEQRNIMQVTLFIKDKYLILKKASLKREFTTKRTKNAAKPDRHFFVKNQITGSPRFCKISDLPLNITLGVSFEKIELSAEKKLVPFPSAPIPKDLISAWKSVLNNSEFADIQFMVQGVPVYAMSPILIARSEYFRDMFTGSWSESNQTDSYHTIEVPDFHPKTFLEMLHYLYTGRVNFKNDPSSSHYPVAIFSIADKYLVKELRQIAYKMISDQLTINNCAELLFKTAWKWPDLKEDIIKYFVRNFKEACESEGFKHIISNPGDYTMFSEVLADLFAALKS